MNSNNLATDQLTMGRITRIYAPIAASWLLMMLESQIVTAGVSRRPDAIVNAGALGVMYALAQWFEAPIIDLITTSTTLSRARSHLPELKRFSLYLVLAVLAIHATVVFTPLYFVVARDWLGLPEQNVVAARIGLMWMLPWAPCIGWRRYCQGLLVRRSETGTVGAGTVIRVAGLSVTALAIFFGTDFSGLTLAGISIIAGVVLETIYVHFASAAVLKGHQFSDDLEAPVEPLGIRKITAFHVPLALSTVILQLQSPLQEGALSRMPEATKSLAAFQYGSGLLWLTVCFSFGLAEVVIALYRNEATAKLLKRFCAFVGVGAAGLVLLLALTGLDSWYLLGPMHANPSLVNMARTAFVTGAPIPILMVAGSYLRAMLIAHHRTAPRLTAMIASTAALFGVLMVGVATRGNGVFWAQAAVTVSLAADLAVLAYAWRSNVSKQILVSVT